MSLAGFFSFSNIHVVFLILDNVIQQHSLLLPLNQSAPMGSSSLSHIFGKVGQFQFFFPERCLLLKLLSHLGCDSHGFLS